MSEKYCFTHDSTPLEEIYPENRKVADADLGCPKCSRLYTWCEVNEILWMSATAKADVVCPNCGFCILSEIDGIKRGCPICKKWYVRSSNWITPFIGYNEDPEVQLLAQSILNDIAETLLDRGDIEDSDYRDENDWESDDQYDEIQK